jgi:hydroxyacylglutathione hydrolase
MKILDGLYGFIWQSANENNCNSFFVDGAKKILIDPGHRHLFQHVKSGLAQIETTPEQIDVVLVTHGHPDHLEMVGSFGPSTRWAMSRIDYEFVMKYIGSRTDFPAPAEKKVLFTGDVVFSQSIGRTDLPGGSGKQLKESISRLAELDVEVLCPGHGEVVAGRENVKKNFKLIKDFWFSQL